MTTVEEAHSASPVTDVEPEPGEPRRRRRRLVRPALGVALISVGAGAGAGVWVWVSNPSTEAASAAAGPVATATVEWGALSATESWDGTLDHGAPFTIDSSAGGTVTRLVAQGETVERGSELYRLNERPVTVLYGGVPMYRDLGPGASGVDVKQLETNLAKLGHDGFAVDEKYAWSTAEAVRAWQEDIGVAQTGRVARGDVVFMPEGGLVDALRVAVGDLVAPGMPVLDVTGTDQVASLEVDVDDLDRLEVGTDVTVLLPDGDKVGGTVSATAVAEGAPESADGAVEGGATESDSILQVEVALKVKAPDEFVGSPVEIVVATDERTGVLMVPVTALLALAEGGYGLEVVADDGATEIVPVDTGLFADGKVQVKGDGIVDGSVVGVAGR